LTKKKKTERREGKGREGKKGKGKEKEKASLYTGQMKSLQLAPALA
jgi:hypothetical protein